MIYGNISTELLMMTDNLEPESLKMIKEHFNLNDDCSEYEVLPSEIEWFIEQDLLDDEFIDMFKNENVDRILLIL